MSVKYWMSNCADIHIDYDIASIWLQMSTVRIIAKTFKLKSSVYVTDNKYNC